jgi:hypothetical protein
MRTREGMKVPKAKGRLPKAGGRERVAATLDRQTGKPALPSTPIGEAARPRLRSS